MVMFILYYLYSNTSYTVIKTATDQENKGTVAVFLRCRTSPENPVGLLLEWPMHTRGADDTITSKQ